ncbi:polyketide cyclase/dehydrase/lipid transport protein [Labedaea rhizosphaerae]|uniref:Polyketide cyclase/dehydrase/lipid transport protein n=1 Tax=Labedaea rhizosphaerae TaxID=598644 RepID=A0A4R6S2G1_LABRH|nr:polyketide cyclase/dehydrase/lipid transport protein [Labedaea rhizosphaerae]
MPTPTVAELVELVRVAAPAEMVWAAVTDWPRQGEWMLATAVRVTGGSGRGAGSTLAARTGVGPLGFTDHMEITSWQPPVRCEVRHTGKVVCGTASFEVRPVGASTSELVWTERLDLPLGALGRVGWPLVRPGFRLGVRYSLRRFAKFAEAYQ